MTKYLWLSIRSMKGHLHVHVQCDFKMDKVKPHTFMLDLHGLWTTEMNSTKCDYFAIWHPWLHLLVTYWIYVCQKLKSILCSSTAQSYTVIITHTSTNYTEILSHWSSLLSTGRALHLLPASRLHQSCSFRTIKMSKAYTITELYINF